MPLFNTITFENNKIFIICDNNNKIWFHAKQICLSLKYKESNKAITKNVDKEDKIQLKNMEINFKVKQQPDTIYITPFLLNNGTVKKVVIAPLKFNSF